MRIAILEPLGISREAMEAKTAPLRAQGHAVTVYADRNPDPAELLRRSAGQDAVVIANTPYPGEVIRACPELKLIDVAFTGIDHVDMAACAAGKVTVCNAAGYSDAAVAEEAAGLALALYRKLAAGDAAVRAGGTSKGLMGREICGRTVGILGTGRIGLRAAKLFQAFGATVIACSRTPREAALALDIRYVSLPELMAESDIVSVHVPNNAQTRGLVSREMIARMKPDAVLINCARGPVVDGAALAEALKEGRIAGAGIDVFDKEPPLPADEPLLSAPNTVLMPHVGFLTEEAMLRRAEIVFANLDAWLKGAPVNVCG